MPTGADNLWRVALETGVSGSWRGIEDLLETPEFHAQLAREYPEGAADVSTLSRRRFLSLLGASAALAGAGGCAQEPAEKIVPYSRTPDGVTPDHVTYYATSMVFEGLATGLVAKSFNGRPIKLDGNPLHPASLGGTGTYHQAALLELYDPNRARGTTLRGQPRPYDDCISDFVMTAGNGDGLRVLMEPTSSPLMETMLDRFRRKYPGAQVHFYSPLGARREELGLKRLTGLALKPRYAFDRAEVVVSLDADFLDATTFAPVNARRFAEGRRQPERSSNRLYTVESTHSITGATSDHRFPVKPSEVRAIALTLLAALRRAPPAAHTPPWVEVVASDLASHGANAVVVAGPDQPADVHAAACAINATLKSRCVDYAPSPILEAGEESHNLAILVDELRRGTVTGLVILGGNPAYTSHPDFDLGELIPRVPRSLYVGLFDNETARRCQWLVPAAHFLESWDDARAFDGSVSFVQPLIRPLYEGKTNAEVLASLTGERGSKAHDLVRERWPVDFSVHLQKGFIPNSATPALALAPTIKWDAVTALLASSPSSGVEAQWKRSYSVFDGRFANNAWLQELPDPMTRQTWGNAALLSPGTAARLDVTAGQHLQVSRNGRSITIPALILPGHADDALTLPLGYGRSESGAEEHARGVGTDTYALWTSDVLDGVAAVTVEVLETHEELALTQTHWSMEDRNVALTRTTEELRQHPSVHSTDETIYSLYDAFKAEGVQWGMAVDLSTCTGCSACVVACQAENNSPVVGKESVLKGREMHWIRVDRYFSGSPVNPAVAMQPMLCQHCEKAPCEYVCPVNATTHSPDGINEMTYNRCVGTRFCSNNCPYKVRRFNWFNFNADKAPTLKLLMNPDVTVRGRGVMEKCNYCVQRIRETEILAQKERRLIRDLEVLTACQQACPTNAIVFGNIADRGSAVAAEMEKPRTYGVLEEMGTRPRTRYLARVKNPNPEIA